MTEKPFSPLLASAIESAATLKYPLLGSPKLDGIRCVIYGGKAVSRSIKLIPNHHVQNLLSKIEHEGLDGELLVGKETDLNAFNATTSGIMSRDGTPDFTFYVFDDWTRGKTVPFEQRISDLQAKWGGHPFITVVPHQIINNPEDLDAYECLRVEQGYEGVMLRDPHGFYKYGRSTLREGTLLKMKRFEDDEATILDFIEELENTNEATINALGHTERSSHKAGMVPKGTLGAFLVRSERFKGTFQLRGKLTAALRQEIWDNKEKYRYKTAKYRFQAVGVLDLPRFPTFQGFRED